MRSNVVRCATGAVIARLAVLTVSAAACADLEPPAPAVAPAVVVTDDEHQRYAADMVFFRARRAAFERDGTVPTVPPSLSSDPHDPELVFRGYQRIGTEAERVAYEARLEASGPPVASREEVASYDQTIEQDAADGPIGVFVNDAGETWAYQPRDLTARLRALRLARGADVRDAAASTIAADPPTTGPVGVATSALGVLGADNRVLRSAMSGFDMTGFPWRTFGVMVPNGQNPAQGPLVHCSATKIGERYLFTAGHCVYDPGGGKGSLFASDWWPGGDGLVKTLTDGDPSPNGFKNIEWAYASSKFFDHGWWSRDYAVLILYDNASSCALGALGYRVDNSLAGQDTWNFGYPSGLHSCAASPDGLCGGSLWGSSGHITRTEVPYIFFTHDIQTGQSGSAVYDFHGGNRQLVGAVQGTYTGVENRGIKIRDRVFDFIDSSRDKRPAHTCHY